MADYSVGNLFLDISAIENGSVKTLSTVTRRLNSLYKSVDNFSKLDTSKSIGKIASFFDTLGTTLSNVSASSVSNLSSISRSISTLQKSLYGLTETNTVLASKSIGVIFDRIALSVDKVDTAKIERLASVTKALSSLKNVSNKITNIDFDKASKGFQQLATAIDPFIKKLKSAETALVSLDSVLKKTNMKTVSNFLGGKSSGGGGNNLAKSLNLAGVVGKLYFIRNYTKQLGQSISKIVQMGMDFTETLNLWAVAMGNNISSAEEFISKMNKAYGIAEETLMRYQATFRNMLSTLGGISPDTSYALSEYIMQMALDYASLYNTSIEKAMTVFQSVLSGQIRPIRTISGYDISESSIFELYQQLGGTKTMRQLTQTEKRLLRIYAVFQQMERSGAVGDLAKTLNSTANTTRVLSETLKSLGTYIGVLLDQYLSPLLTKVTAFAITVTNIIKAIAQPIIDKKKEELGEYGLAWDETAESIEDTSEAYEEFIGKLLDFDKFRSLSDNKENPLGLGIDEKLLEGLMQYESVLDGVTSEAQELAKEWTSLFIDDTGNFTKKAKELWEALKDIAETAGVILGIITLIKSPFLAIGAYIAYAYTTNEEFRESCNKLYTKIKEELYPKVKEIVDKFIEWVSEGHNLENVIKLIMGTKFITWVSNLLGTNTMQSAGILGLVSGVGKLINVFDEFKNKNYKEAINGIEDAVGDLLLGIGLLTKSPWVIVIGIVWEISKSIADILVVDMEKGLTEVQKKIIKIGEDINEAIGGKKFGDWLINGINKLLGIDPSKVPKFAEGGMPDKGTLFIAGEAGAEMVYNTPSGQSGVANVQQIAQASYSGTKQALVDWWKSAQGDIPSFREVSKTGIYEVVDGEARRRGRVLGTV